MRISELEQQLFSIREQCGDVDIVYINSNQTTGALRKNYLKVSNGSSACEHLQAHTGSFSP